MSPKEKVQKFTEEIKSETANYLDAVGLGKSLHEVKEIRNNLTFLQNELEKALKQQLRTH